jgi:orotate phosphoribosyltransferase
MMIMTQNMKKKLISTALLTHKAVVLNTEEPFTFSSGIKSPIYCDNRTLLAYPSARDSVISEFVSIIKYLDPDIVAGTATAGISWAAWVADRLRLPMAYVRQSKKEYGKNNQIEGAKVKGKRVVVIEDLVSTGGSSLQAIQAVRDQGGVVDDLVAIFSYGFKASTQSFVDNHVTFSALVDLPFLLGIAIEKNVINDDQKMLLESWQNNPRGWKS